MAPTLFCRNDSLTGLANYPAHFSYVKLLLITRFE